MTQPADDITERLHAEIDLTAARDRPLLLRLMQAFREGIAADEPWPNAADSDNPSEALRKARDEPVLVLNRNKPDVLMVGVELAGALDAAGVRPALATALFRDGHLSLAHT